MMKSLALAALLAVAMGGVASADPQTSTAADRMWHAQDACAKKAFKQYPDYTPDGNARRAQARRLCLATGNLPPRNEQPIQAAPADATPAR